MPALNKELSYFKAGLKALENYLLSESLYWVLEEQPIQLTIGGLLLCGKRIEAFSGISEWPALYNQLDVIRSRWLAHWENKVLYEIHARIDLWKNALLEIQEDSSADYYPQRVSWRVMLQLLLGETSRASKEMETINELDMILKTSWRPGPFIWEAQLANAFPGQDYWFLYGKFNPDDRSSND